jgi:cytochrome c biogenesis protein CcmG/thiol:disulfide interchange protein DsbE
MSQRRGLCGLAVVSIALATAACSSPSAPVRTGTEASGVPGPTTASSDQVAALRAAADLPPCPSADGEPSSGSDLPTVELACLGDGADVAVAGLVGRPYVLNFWASWCAECVAEVPFLQEIADEAAGQLQVLGVNYLDVEPAALQAAPDFGLGYPSLFDPEGSLGQTFHLPGLPMTFFIDATGAIVGQQTGPFDSVDDLRQMIQSELGITL